MLVQNKLNFTAMKFTLLLLLLITLYQISFPQSRVLTDEDLNRSTAHKIIFEDTLSCDDVEKWIKSDIANKTLFIFIQGGIAPVYYSNDRKFENKYGVYFNDFGDTGPPSDVCIKKYNYYVFEYLIKTYGREWIKEMRKDVIGFSEWKKSN